MPITANDVAALAIVAGVAGIMLTNWNQRAMARQQYIRDYQTTTYLKMLQGVRRRQLRLGDAINLPLPAPTEPADSGELSDEETESAAMILAFASPDAQKLWSDFADADDNLWYLATREGGNKPPDLIAEVIARYAQASGRWLKARDLLVLQVRAELRTSQRSPWRSNRSRSLLGKILESARGQVPRPPELREPPATAQQDQD